MNEGDVAAVWRLARKMASRSHEPAEDLASAGVVAFLEAQKRYRPDGGASMRTFCLTSSRYAMIDVLRATRFCLSIDEAARVADGRQPVDDQVDARRRLEDLAASADGRVETALVAAAISGRTQLEVSREHGISKSWASRTMAKLVRKAEDAAVKVSTKIGRESGPRRGHAPSPEDRAEHSVAARIKEVFAAADGDRMTWLDSHTIKRCRTPDCGTRLNEECQPIGFCMRCQKRGRAAAAMAADSMTAMEAIVADVEVESPPEPAAVAATPAAERLEEVVVSENVCSECKKPTNKNNTLGAHLACLKAAGKPYTAGRATTKAPKAPKIKGVIAQLERVYGPHASGLPDPETLPLDYLIKCVEVAKAYENRLKNALK